ncbi:MAG: triose-phosphate isomerase [Inquilinus sp.]|nr:triose-phosphate isomerase [Inquilinus sp.]
MPMNRKLIAGNWKMNGLSAEAEALAGDLARRYRGAGAPAFDMLLCPPAPAIGLVGRTIAGSGLALGGQDCHADPKGAHTGDISAEMLGDLGCSHVIVGHSERRQDHGETDEQVAAKAAAALGAGLIAVICVGETLEERDAGETLDVCGRQLAGSLPPGANPDTVVIAYEPVWAIGTGRTPTVDDVGVTHSHIRGTLSGRIAGAERVRILYGGSVKPSNAAELMAVANVDGALVGGASLVADDFWAIGAACG